MLHELGAGASLSAEDEDKSTAAHMACRPEEGDLCDEDVRDGLKGCLRVLHELGVGASLSAEDATKRTPAHFAAEFGLEGCLRVLHELGAGASLSAEDASKRTPAHLAAMNQEMDDDDYEQVNACYEGAVCIGDTGCVLFLSDIGATAALLRDVQGRPELIHDKYTSSE